MEGFGLNLMLAMSASMDSPGSMPLLQLLSLLDVLDSGVLSSCSWAAAAAEARCRLFAESASVPIVASLRLEQGEASTALCRRVFRSFSSAAAASRATLSCAAAISCDAKRAITAATGRVRASTAPALEFKRLSTCEEVIEQRPVNVLEQGYTLCCEENKLCCEEQEDRRVSEVTAVVSVPVEDTEERRLSICGSIEPERPQGEAERRSMGGAALCLLADGEGPSVVSTVDRIEQSSPVLVDGVSPDCWDSPRLR